MRITNTIPPTQSGQRVDLHHFQREAMRPLLITIILIAPILMSGCTQSDVDTSEQSMGCTYPEAVNFNSSSIIDDGSCIYPDAPAKILGCMYSDALNHNPSATEDDGSCRYPVVPEPVPGCTYPEAYNYEMNATEDDGTCVYDSDGDGIIDAFEQPGCTDINANNQTGPGGKYENYPVKMVAVERGFHGRTDRPAQISHSCKSGYDKNLATFQNRDNLILVPANDPSALESVFQRAVDEKFFIELVAIEPIQGEGNPGLCVTREFYDTARRLTKEYDSMLLVDSIQAGIRGQGCLSVIDYDGFQDAEVPDMETWSKAINAGQYPLSVLGMNDRASSMYVVGIYGNTMTTNPRALETAVAVLEQITPELRHNIKERGDEFVAKLKRLAEELPGTITKVQGTGLLLSAELEPSKFPVVGFDAVEPWCRRKGLGVIHGGHNALRFTPHFRITSEEIDLIIDIVKEALIEFS